MNQFNGVPGQSQENTDPTVEKHNRYNEIVVEVNDMITKRRELDAARSHYLDAMAGKGATENLDQLQKTYEDLLRSNNEQGITDDRIQELTTQAREALN